MRRTRLGAVLGILLTCGALVPATAARAVTPPPPPAAAPSDEPARGLVHQGLRAAGPHGSCPPGFELGEVGSGRCTHGPDPAPPGVDVRRHRPVAALATEPSEAAATSGGALLCEGDGTDGKRVQAIYAVASDRTDRFASIAPLIPEWALAVDATVSASAAETGGVRHVRWVTNADCSLSVVKVVLSPTGDDSLTATEDELTAKGFTDIARKYLVWTDANEYCGIGGVYKDDRAGQDNANNGGRGAPPLFGRIDSGCWGRSSSVEAHELMHTLGGVQLSAPHSNGGFHCTDESDLMCYDDDGDPLTSPLSYPCPVSHEALFDCNHDDYFSTSPPAGSYLAQHWNTAASAFLTSTPALTLDVTAPATPTGLAAVPGDRQVSLSWSPVADPDLAGYRVRRDGVVVASVTANAFTDTGLANGTAYTYTVSSYDGSGNQSASSAPVTATPQAPPPPVTTTTTSAPPATVTTTTTAPPAAATPAPTPVPVPLDGYRLVGTDGRSFGFGSAGALASSGPLPLTPAQPVVDAAATPDGTGTWAATVDGGVFTLGSARFLGSLGGARLNQPIVGMAATRSGNGYWLVASDGGIFAFGDARFFGSTGAIRLNQPIVGMAATPSGGGYWLVASDGGIFAFGDARFSGSTGAIRLNQPVVGMASTPTGNGYLLVASDGGIFAFGDARFFGSTGAIRLNQPIVAMSASATGGGYRFVASDGGVFAFGDARFLGSAANQGATITAMAGPAR